MAADAASLISIGHAKSGKPWARLTAPCSSARRVISRMTDSVKLAALLDTRATRTEVVVMCASCTCATRDSMVYARSVTCPRCGAETRPGQKFCAECGLALDAACPNCGASYEPGQKFCADCGTALAAPTTN